MNEVNYAALERRRNEGKLTLAECRRMGSTHHAYGWSRTPDGAMNKAQRAAYFEGWDSYKEDTL